MQTPTTTPAPTQGKKIFGTRGLPHTTRNTRFPGSLLAAKELGVNHAHLYRVLAGLRRSACLLARYREWLAARPELPAADIQPQPQNTNL